MKDKVIFVFDNWNYNREQVKSFTREQCESRLIKDYDNVNRLYLSDMDYNSLEIMFNDNPDWVRVFDR